jgi:hypothetical protein
MTETKLELLVTAVIVADTEHKALAACRPIAHLIGGHVLETRDCSDEEPDCWAVTITRRTPWRDDRPVRLALTEAVRLAAQQLGVHASSVACEPPVAWTVLDDPALVNVVGQGVERLLIEAWAIGDLIPHRGVHSEALK